MISDKQTIHAIPDRDVVNLETGRVNVLSSTVLNGVQYYLRRLVSKKNNVGLFDAAVVQHDVSSCRPMQQS